MHRSVLLCRAELQRESGPVQVAAVAAAALTAAVAASSAAEAPSAAEAETSSAAMMAAHPERQQLQWVPLPPPMPTARTTT